MTDAWPAVVAILILILVMVLRDIADQRTERRWRKDYPHGRTNRH